MAWVGSEGARATDSRFQKPQAVPSCFKTGKAMAPSSSSAGKRPRKRRIPQAGDPDFKTPTQLRNARKRRKKKAEKKAGGKQLPHDPSLRYLANPTACPVVKQAISFFKNQKRDFDVIVGPTTQWRTVAKLAVRMQAGCVRIGLFVPGTHEVLELPQCAAHHPNINTAIEYLQEKCGDCLISAYDEKTGEGSLKHICINIERSTGRQQITLVWNGLSAKGEEKTKLNSLCDSMVSDSERESEHRVKLHSLWVHYNNAGKHDNSILAHDGRWQKRYGKGSIIETLEVDPDVSVPLMFVPQVFRQANLSAFTNIVIQIRRWVGRRTALRCLELYGGVGTIGLHLADLCESIVSSDENPYNKACFEYAVENLKVKTRPKSWVPDTSYESKNASAMIKTGAFRAADLIVVDPPRRGLDDDVLQALCKNESGSLLVYVSCCLGAFIRDFRTLTGIGNWKLDHAEGHLLFPGSDAIETLAFFFR